MHKTTNYADRLPYFYLQQARWASASLLLPFRKQTGSGRDYTPPTPPTLLPPATSPAFRQAPTLAPPLSIRCFPAPSLPTRRRPALTTPHHIRAIPYRQFRGRRESPTAIEVTLYGISSRDNEFHASVLWYYTSAACVEPTLLCRTPAANLQFNNPCNSCLVSCLPDVCYVKYRISTTKGLCKRVRSPTWPCTISRTPTHTHTPTYPATAPQRQSYPAAAKESRSAPHPERQASARSFAATAPKMGARGGPFHRTLRRRRRRGRRWHPRSRWKASPVHRPPCWLRRPSLPSGLSWTCAAPCVPRWLAARYADGKKVLVCLKQGDGRMECGGGESRVVYFECARRELLRSRKQRERTRRTFLGGGGLLPGCCWGR